MISRVCVFLLVGVAQVCLSQDSLVFYKELHFSSVFEKEAFDQYLKRKINDPFTLLMANGGLMKDDQILNHKERFYGLLKDLNNEKFATKKPDKKVKAVIDLIQQQYLKKYVADSRFEDTFYNGNFNELTGSALYGLAFEYLGIPYSIKEDPAKIYVIALPYTEKIMIESTLLRATGTTFNDQFKKEYVQMLRRQKVISEQEYNRLPTPALFDNYYFNSETLTLTALAGTQYMHDALRLSENQEHEAAFYQMEKASMLNTSNQVVYLLMTAGNQAFANHNEKDVEHARLLGKVSRYKAIGTTDEMISAELYRSINALLFDKNQKDKTETYYNTLIELVTNEQTKTELSFLYYFENGRYLYNQARYKDALPYLDQALSAKPVNQDAATLFIASLEHIATNNYQDETYLMLLKSYQEKHSELETNNLFNNLVASVYLAHFGLKYEAGKPTEGDAYKKQFESIYARHSDLNINAALVAQSYSTAAVYYFKKGQTKKAQEILASGLKISPNNRELLIRKDMIK